MSPELHRLVYYSKNRISSVHHTDGEIQSILSAARRNNSSCGITGALIFNSGIFAQVLEGELRAIETIFEKIQRDERHGEVQVLAFEKTPARTFPGWSMGYVGRSLNSKNVFGHIGPKTGFEARLLEGERILNIMQTIAIEEEANVEG
jgi:hypothetical protein